MTDTLAKKEKEEEWLNKINQRAGKMIKEANDLNHIKSEVGKKNYEFSQRFLKKAKISANLNYNKSGACINKIDSNLDYDLNIIKRTGISFNLAKDYFQIILETITQDLSHHDKSALERTIDRFTLKNRNKYTFLKSTNEFAKDTIAVETKIPLKNNNEFFAYAETAKDFGTIYQIIWAYHA